MIFAFSACSSFILLASSVKNPQKKISISIKRKEPLTAEICEDAEGIIDS